MAGLTLALLLFGLSMALGLAQGWVVTTVQATGEQMKRWGGAVLVLIGLWVLALALFAGGFAEIFPV